MSVQNGKVHGFWSINDFVSGILSVQEILFPTRKNTKTSKFMLARKDNKLKTTFYQCLKGEVNETY